MPGTAVCGSGSVGPSRRGERDGWTCGGAGGTPGAVRGGGVSKSATKAPRAGIGREEKPGISTILLARLGPIGAFVADLDNPRRRRPPGGAPRASQRPGRAPPALRRALRIRKCSSNRHSREQNAPLDEEGAGRGRRGPRRRPPWDISSDLVRKAHSQRALPHDARRSHGPAGPSTPRAPWESPPQH